MGITFYQMLFMHRLRKSWFSSFALLIGWLALVDRMMNPEGYPHPNCFNLHILENEIRVADGIKITNQMNIK